MSIDERGRPQSEPGTSPSLAAFRGVQTVAIGSLFALDRGGSVAAGGLAATVSTQAAALGATGIAVGRVGMDRFGRDIVERLRELKADTSAIQTDPDQPTARWLDRGTLARIEPFAAFDTLQWDADVEALARSAELIVTDACGRRHGQSRSTIDRMLIAAPSAVRIIDLTLRPPSDPPRLDREQVGQALELCTVLVADAVALRSLVPAAQTVSEGAKRLFEMTRRAAVIVPATSRDEGWVVQARGSEVLAPLDAPQTARSEAATGRAAVRSALPAESIVSAALVAGLALVTGTALVEVL